MKLLKSKDTGKEKKDRSSISIAKNTIFNLIGYGVSLLFAVFLIPRLIHHLGDERFGLLSIVWIVIGYFSF